MAVPDRAPAQAVAPPAPAGRGIAALEPVPPVLLVIAGATSIQFGAALAATLFDDLGPAGTSLMRLGFAAVILVALWRPRPSAYSAPALRLATLFGLMLGVMNLSFYEALDRIPLGIAVTLEFAGPVTIAVALSRRRLDLLWVALAVGGILLLANPGGGSLDPVGLLFIAVAAAAWAAYILLAQRAGAVFSGGSGLAIAMVVGALVPLGPGIAQAGSHLLDPGLLALGAGVALLSSVIPYTLETEALRRVPAHVFGVLMSLEPAVAAIAGYLVLHQRLSTRDAVAICLVIAASIGVTRSRPPAIEA
jgi:inner membrane transporter RhtA